MSGAWCMVRGAWCVGGSEQWLLCVEGCVVGCLLDREEVESLAHHAVVASLGLLLKPLVLLELLLALPSSAVDPLLARNRRSE